MATKPSSARRFQVAKKKVERMGSHASTQIVLEVGRARGSRAIRGGVGYPLSRHRTIVSSISIYIRSAWAVLGLSAPQSPAHLAIRSKTVLVLVNAPTLEVRSSWDARVGGFAVVTRTRNCAGSAMHVAINQKNIKG